MLKTEDLFDLNHTLASPILHKAEYPWQILDDLSTFISDLGQTLSPEEYDSPGPGVWVAKDAVIYPTAFLCAPCIIGHRSEVRHCAFIRGSALIGNDVVIGNSTEIKNAVIFDNAEIPHFNYVGDSVIGYKAHLGAGAVTSNIKSDKTPILVRDGQESMPTGRVKIGAMVGDRAEVGCNSVLNPGTVLGKDAQVYPLSRVRGTVPARHIYKDAGQIVPKR